jgi:hypothetical protein
MADEQKEKEQETEFVVDPLSDEELEDVSGGEALDSCIGGSGCCDGFVNAVES